MSGKTFIKATLALIASVSFLPTGVFGQDEPGLRVCNLSGEPIEFAKGVKTWNPPSPKVGYVIEGWYRLAGGECALVWQGKLPTTYDFYLYAKSRVSEKVWKGEIPLCVADGPFTNRDGLALRCEASGKRMFFEVNPGTAENFTQNLRL